LNEPEGYFKTDLNTVAANYQCIGCVMNGNSYSTISNVYAAFTNGNYETGDSYSDGVMWFNYSLISHPVNNFVFERKMNLDNNKKSTEFTNSLLITPTPCDNLLNIFNSKSENYIARLTDSFGKDCIVVQNAKSINTSELQNGIYYLTLLLKSSGEVINKKVVIVHSSKK
jgi:Secretion system C-terminal sorting domain